MRSFFLASIIFFSSNLLASDFDNSVPGLLKKINDLDFISLGAPDLCESKPNLESAPQTNDFCTKLKESKLIQTPWPKRSLTVCWRAHPDRSQFKYIKPEEMIQTIKKAIVGEFKLEVTGIEFIKWDECDNKNKYDVELYFYEEISNGPYEKNTPGIGGLSGGNGYQGTDKPTYPNISYNSANGKIWSAKVPLNDALSITSLHEFAHIAGLNHNHSHEDWFKLQTKQTDVYPQGHDNSSIMNYITLGDIMTKGLGFNQRKENRLVSKNGRNVQVLSIDDETEEVQFKPIFSDDDLKALRCLYP